MSSLKTIAALSAIAGFTVLMHEWGDSYSIAPLADAGAVQSPATRGVVTAPEPSLSLVRAAKAQPGKPADPALSTQAAPSIPQSNAPPQIDLTALRYFAQQGDTRRLEAEIARLKALYPTWQPPENPLDIPAASQSDPELDRIWELYAQGKLAEVRQAIAARQESEPGWQPPADLLERVAVAEARLQLVNASNLQQYATVIRVASETPSLLTCSEVDVLWRLARAFAETNRPDRAKDAYLYVLNSCDNVGERLATLQMASQRLARADLDALLATERTGPDEVGEFASVRADFARKSLAEAADDSSIQVSAGDLDLLRQLAEAPDGRASDSELLGWYALRRGETGRALSDFERARARQDSATISQGYALALISLGRFADAEGAMAQWRSASDGARAVYLAAAANYLASSSGQVVAPETLARIVAATGEARNAASAQQLGWYAYALNQFPTAGQWFSAALGWKSDDEQSAYGLGLVRQRLGDQAGLLLLQRDWGARSPRIAAIGQPDQAAVAAAQAAREASGGPPPALAMATTPVPTSPMQLPASRASDLGAAPAAVPLAPASDMAASAVSPSAVLPQEAFVRSMAPPPATAAPAPRRPATASASGRAGLRNCGGPQVEPSTFSAENAMAHGWCLLNLGRSLEAASAFESAARRGQGRIRQDAAYGESLAYLRLGVGDRAAIAAARSPQPAQRRIELDVAILSARATSAFEARRPVEALQALDERSRLAPERLDLLVLRGYAYLELRRFGDAERVFSAVARTGSQEGVRGLAALNQALGRFPTDG